MRPKKKQIKVRDRAGVSRVHLPAPVVDALIRSPRNFRKFVTRLDAIGLRTKIEVRALQLHVSLRDLYEGGGAGRVPPSIANARRFIYLWLMKEGQGNNEIARLFDRAPNSVWKLTRGSK